MEFRDIACSATITVSVGIRRGFLRSINRIAHSEWGDCRKCRNPTSWNVYITCITDTAMNGKQIT